MVTERGGGRVVPEETLMVLRTTDVNQGDKEGGREGRGGGSAGCVCVCVIKPVLHVNTPFESVYEKNKLPVLQECD